MERATRSDSFAAVLSPLGLEITVSGWTLARARPAMAGREALGSEYGAHLFEQANQTGGINAGNKKLAVGVVEIERVEHRTEPPGPTERNAIFGWDLAI